MALLVAGAFFMEIVDATIITPAIPLIASSFGVDPVDVSVRSRPTSSPSQS
jgi:hypothetical protein